MYWKGEIPLVDRSLAEFLVMEDSSKEGPSYSITITNPRDAATKVLGHYRDRTFRSARQAVWQLHHDVNDELYRQAKE